VWGAGRVKEDPELRRSAISTEQLIGFQHGAATDIDRHAIMCVASGPHQGRRLSCQTAHVPETWAVDLFSRWLAA
jgi:hypothetical protein